MIFLRFPDEQTFIEETASYRGEEGNLTLPNIDVVGVIAKGGTYADDGNVIDPPIEIDGYHVNAVDIPDEWQQYIISRPNKPYRIFAGR